VTPRRVTPLARMLAEPDAQKRVTALDALALAQQKWLAGERLDIGKLADELGVGRATVFRWVGSKEQLYGEVISAAFSATLDWAARSSSGTGAAFLTQVTHHLLRALVASQPLRRFVQGDPELGLRIVMSRSSPVEQRVIASVRALIQAQVQAGHLKPAMELESLAYVIVRIAESFLYRDVITGDKPDIETATQAIGLLFTAQAPTKRKRRRSR
jgi:AcrR family transcriptional regulator